MTQAGRAIRAAQQPDEAFSRSGTHGITVVAESVHNGLATAQIRDEKNKPTGAFGEVALTLGRASLSRPMTVGELVATVLPTARFPLKAPRLPLPNLQLSLIPLNGFHAGSEHELGLRAVLRAPVDWAVELPGTPQRTTDHYDAYRTAIYQRLEDYPTLRDARLFESAPGHFQSQLSGGGSLDIQLHWPDLPAGPSNRAALHQFSDQNEDTVIVWPRPGSSEPGISLARHPFLSWWAVLCVVAHFIRYEPVTWAELIDVDRSEEAVSIEELSDLAVTMLPELIHRTLVRTEPQ